MHLSAVRGLALACGILLALPPGWCCLLRPFQACPAAPPGAAVAGDDCCCGCRAPKPPVPPRPESPTPRGPLDRGCCCADRRATDPADGKQTADPAPACLALPVADEPLPLSPHAAPAATRPFGFHSPPVNLLHCVWLC